MTPELYDVIEAIELMALRNDIFSDNHGNISCYVKEKDILIIKPSGMNFADITERDLVIYDMKLAKLAKGCRKPSVDLDQHIEIYKNKNIGAVCHSHSKYVVGHAVAKSDIVCMSTEQADTFGNDIKCLNINDDDYQLWGKHVRDNLPLKACLLPNHGAVTISSNPVDAVKLAIRIEEIAEKNYIANMIKGSNNCRLSDKVISSFNKRYTTRYGQ